MTQTSGTRVIEGVVEAKSRDGAGLKVDGHWFNPSQWSKVDLSVLRVGQKVKMTVTGDKWIRSLEVVSDQPAQESQESQQEPAQNARDDRERMIVRSVALKEAVRWLGTCPQPQREDVERVLNVARAFETWLLRS